MRTLYYHKVECNECNGDGVVLVGPSCSYPASMCCGGCYKELDCTACAGKGYKEVEFNSDDIKHLIDTLLDDEGNDAVAYVQEKIQYESN
jgi:hypothetical protein